MQSNNAGSSYAAEAATPSPGKPARSGREIQAGNAVSKTTGDDVPPRQSLSLSLTCMRFLEKGTYLATACWRLQIKTRETEIYLGTYQWGLTNGLRVKTRHLPREIDFLDVLEFHVGFIRSCAKCTRTRTMLSSLVMLAAYPTNTLG